MTQQKEKNADAAQTDSLLDADKVMEMTRVDIVGNKSTSYNLLSSQTKKKMVIVPHGSDSRVASHRYVPYVLLILSILVFSLVILFTLGYLKMKTEMRTQRQEVMRCFVANRDPAFEAPINPKVEGKKKINHFEIPPPT